MKLFHTENGKEVVYVQLRDIMELKSSDIPMPASIRTKVYKKGEISIVAVDNSNWFNFVKFDEASEVEFLKKIEFILDYDEFKDMNDDQLQKERDKLATKFSESVEKLDSMSEDETEESKNLERKCENLGYMLNSLMEIYEIKHNKRTMPFPEFVSGKKPPQNKTPFWKRFFCWKKCK